MKEPKRTTGLELACRAIKRVSVDAFIAACDGDQTLGVFMHYLCSWIATTESNLAIAKQQAWIACSRDDWLKKRRPWGKKVKKSPTTFSHMLTVGKKLDVLRKTTGRVSFNRWEDPILHVAPTDIFFEKLRYYDTRLATTWQAVGNPLATHWQPDGNSTAAPDHHTHGHGHGHLVSGAPASAGACPPTPGEEPSAESHDSSKKSLPHLDGDKIYQPSKKLVTLDDLLLCKDKESLSPDLKQLLLDVMNDDSGQFTGQESLDEVRGVLADKAQPTNPEKPPEPLPPKVLPEPDKVVPLFPQKAA
jgi:hypothetical protein